MQSGGIVTQDPRGFIDEDGCALVMPTRWEPVAWINLDTREIRETPRDERGKFITSDRVSGPPKAARTVRLDPVYGHRRCVCGVYVNERWWHRIFAGHGYKGA